MTPEAEMKSLIERLENATGPDRKLDAEIAVALDIRSEWAIGMGALWVDDDDRGDGPTIRIHTVGKRRSSGHPPMGDYLRYTASIDAALTLVTDDWTAWALDSRMDKQRFTAELSKLVSGDEQYAVGRAPTAPLALCIAALKARSV